MPGFTVAAAQMTSGPDKSKNLATATRLVEEAAGRGAQLVALPELFNCLANPEIIVSQAETIPGPTSTAMSQLAARLQVTLLAGSIAERSETWPEGVSFRVLGDQSEGIEISVTDLQNNIITALILVVAVLLLFMGARNSIFVAVALCLARSVWLPVDASLQVLLTITDFSAALACLLVLWTVRNEPSR